MILISYIYIYIYMNYSTISSGAANRGKQALVSHVVLFLGRMTPFTTALDYSRPPRAFSTRLQLLQFSLSSSSSFPSFLLPSLLLFLLSTLLWTLLFWVLYHALLAVLRIRMSSSANGASRPPFTHGDQPDSQSRLLKHDATLVVAQSVSLTLGGDSLLVVGMYYQPDVHAPASHWMVLVH